MTGVRQEPDPTRPCISTGDAGRILRCLPITVRRRIERGELAGGQKPSGKWYVYADQVPGAALTAARPAARSDTLESDSTAREIAELRAQLAEVRAERAEELARYISDQKAQLADQNIQLIAAVQAMTEVLGEFQKGTEHFQSGSSRLANVVSSLVDTMTAANTPNSPEGLELP
jgi:hypothetical protein